VRLRFKILIAATLVLIAAWSAAWFYAAGQLEATLRETRDRVRDTGGELLCADEEVRGYPFRIGVFCSRVAYENPSSGLGLRTGELRSAAQLYRPGRLVGELESPLALTGPAGTLEADWNSMRGSTSLGLNGPERFSLAGNDVIAKGPEGTVQMSNFQFHGLKINDDDARYAVVMLDTDLPGVENIPSFDLRSEMLLDNAWQRLLAEPDVLQLARANGLTGRLNRFAFAAQGGGRLRLSGPFTITSSGILSGNFQIEVEKIEALASAFETRFSFLRDYMPALAAMGRLGNTRATLNVRNGQASLGIIPLGPIPPLF